MIIIIESDKIIFFFYLQPPMSNMRNDDRPMDIWNAGSTNLTSNVMSASQQHRMSNNQTSQQPQQQQQTQSQQQQQQQPQHQQRDQQRDQQQHQQQRPPRIGPSQKDNRGRRDWPDNHQLFVGNVSHQATDSELRSIFEKFGRVADLRIFSKSNDRGKGQQGQNNPMRVPHYGFVTFEDATSVAKVLAAHANKVIFIFYFGIFKSMISAVENTNYILLVNFFCD